MLRKILIGVVVVAIIGVAGAWGYYQAMVAGYIRYNEYDIRTEGQLQVGDLAPDLELARVGPAAGEPTAGDSEVGDGDLAAPVMLSDLYREKPVVLAFGSYT